tara:strand:- start:665 stop:1054 length:390 start_codon:yes stop_codon:yes gene_type:complete
MKEDILNIDDVKLLVDHFYDKVREDALLADIFNNRIGEKWSEHLEKMYRFWQTVLLEEHTYFGSPFLPHANLPVDKAHFERWLSLFDETVNEQFTGQKAERAKWQGARMAEMFLSKIKYHKKHSTKPLL